MKRATGGTKSAKKATSTATIIAAEHVEISDAAPAVAAVAAVAATPAKPVRKRESKKKFPIVAIVTPDGIDGNFMMEPRRPLIAHLPIRSNEVVFHDVLMQYDPAPPMEPDPFDQGFEMYQTTSETIQHQNTIFDSAPEQLKTEAEAAAAAAAAATSSATGETSTEMADRQITPPQTPSAFSKAELLVSYKNTQQTQTIPDTTTVACFWCCHSFDNQPCIIPIREEKGIYEIYGNFCCPECTLAYILEERDDSHVKWEKISLLHRIYGPSVAPNGGRIYPAPARATLALFGGALSIEAFRKTMRDGKVRLDIHLPPMISILATMDTKPIDFYETTIPKSFVPLNSDRVQKVEECLRLKRTKPLKDKENTLDAVMNLQIRRVPVVNPVDLELLAC